MKQFRATEIPTILEGKFHETLDTDTDRKSVSAMTTKRKSSTNKFQNRWTNKVPVKGALLAVREGNYMIPAEWRIKLTHSRYLLFSKYDK